MTKEDILRMAREVGLTDESFERDWYVYQLERFAALHRAAVLEEAAQKCDDLWQDDGTAYDCREAIRALKEKT